ncbi:MAG: LysR substrate-binding domain-containing protein [Acidimicrobiia bacterium]|nr:LysR substrate-binding domain-containing protein [Acidimicrobiia bacterium]
MRRYLAVVAIVLIASCASPDRVIMAAGTTLVDGGLIPELVAAYEAANPGTAISVVAESSARILDLGARGAADILITHAPGLEAAFVDAESPRLTVGVFESRFVLVGPAGLAPDGLGFDEALGWIRQHGGPFVSRGDGSGTHEAELAAWGRLGGSPVGEPWYIETGQGMGLTLQVADQRAAFTIAEEGALIAAAGLLDIEEVATTDWPSNPYTLTIPADASGDAEDFADWLMSESGRTALSAINTALYGRQVYAPTG